MATLLIYILSAFSYLLPISYFLPFKLKISQKIILFFIIFANIFFISSILGNVGVILLILTSCIYLALINTNRFINICVFIATYLFCVIWDNLFSLVWRIFGFSFEKIQNSPLLFFLYTIIYIVSLNIVCPFIAHIIKKFFSTKNKLISKEVIMMISSNLFLCLFIFLFNIVVGEYIGYNTKILIFNCVLFACYFLASTILIINIIKEHSSKMELEMKQDSYEKLQSYTTQIENMYSSLRAFKHDYSNIMLSMAGYIETDDMEGLKKFFYKEISPLNTKLLTRTAHFNQLLNIKVLELKSIISTKLLYANELGIAVNIEVDEEISDIPIDIIDLSRVLGIYLDNAIEAALETDSPCITFAFIKAPAEFVLIISNTFINKGISFSNMKKPSVSTKGSNRGWGLYNASTILSQYKNVLSDTEIKENLFIQRIYISRNIPESSSTASFH